MRPDVDEAASRVETPGPGSRRIVYAGVVMRGSSLVAVGAAALTGCFQGDFLRNTCEQQGGCTGVTSTSTGGATTSPPTTGEGTSTSTSSSSGSDDTAASGTTGPLPGVPFDGLAFRIDTIEIVDPHLYYSGFNCVDATGFVNGALQKSIVDRDSNVLLVARDYDPNADFQEFLMYRDANCPVDEDYCLLIGTVLPVTFISGNKDDDNCLDVMISTVNPANVEQLNLPNSPCVSSPTASVELELAPELSPIKFYNGKFSAQYSPSDDDPSALVNAILYGFVPQSDAELIMFKLMETVINFWAVIRGSGHVDSCPVPMGGLPDVDMLDLDGDGPMEPVNGIYLYLNFTAERVNLYAPF